MKREDFKGISTFPPFEYSELEARAVSLMQLLGAQPLSLRLEPEVRQAVEHLANAYRKAHKQVAFQLSADFFAAVLNPAKLQMAYAQILAQPIIRHSEFQMVLDCLKELCAAPPNPQLHPVPSTPLSLEEALQLLLLKLTQSDKNAIYYNRIDSCTGKPRPTTFPLTETLIAHFLAPFAETGEKAKKVLIFQKGLVMANPALILAWEYRTRKQKYEQEKARWEAGQAAKQPQPIAPPAATPVAPLAASQAEPRLISEELERVLASLSDPDEQVALKQGLKPDNFGLLWHAARLPGEDFGKTFKQVCAHNLSPAKASLLAARMSARIKRLLATTGDWNEDYWRNFQSLMQTLGLWEGQAWLEKWRADKHGKQNRAKTGADYVIPEKHDALTQQLKQAEVLRDKQRGKHMLSQADMSDWIKPPTRNVPPEQRKVLAVLARSDRLEELLSLALPPEVLARTSPELQTRLYQVFGLLADTDMDTIKTRYLADLPPENCDAAKSLIAAVERSFHRLSSLFRQDFKMTFPLALKMLRDQEEMVRQRQKMNTPQYSNSPAARYQSYQQGLG